MTHSSDKHEVGKLDAAFGEKPMARQFGGGPVGRNSKAGLIVALAMIVVGAFLFAALYMLGNTKGRVPGLAQAPVQATEQYKTKDVLVALREIQSSEELNPSMFRVESRTAASVSDQAVGSYEGIQGQYAKRTIAMGQSLSLQDVSKTRSKSAISHQIPEGYRAVTIRVDEVTSVEGFARPGAKVDVIWIATINGIPTSTTIVENAQVLSAERMTENNNAEKQEAGAAVPNTVTLLVNTGDSAKIQLASSTGKLQLSLRGDEDPGVDGKAPVRVTLPDLTRGGERQTEQVRNEGWVEVGGQKFLMVNGRLQPASRKKAN